MAMFMVKPWYRVSGADAEIYGAEWNGGSSSSSWTRTDAAANFSRPNPYYANISGQPSSPFDDIMPWSGIRRVTDASAGELVEIPKFYYKWTRSGTSGKVMKLQISMTKHDGFLCSPAHADRGDGVGERDYVYIGRYACSGNSSSSYKSVTGVYPKINTSISTFRSGIHNLGNTIWQSDFAMFWTIRMLYLVEFADWNSQSRIGYGCGSKKEYTGATDALTYHTGSATATRITYGHTQYRWIEDLWSNVENFVDGIYFNSNDIYCIKNPSDFNNTSGGTLVGQRPANTGLIAEWTDPSSISGFEYALYPSRLSSFPSTMDNLYNYYVCDSTTNNSDVALITGGPYSNNNQVFGLFMLSDIDTTGWPRVGSRLMVLPPSRLTA